MPVYGFAALPQEVITPKYSTRDRGHHHRLQDRGRALLVRPGHRCRAASAPQRADHGRAPGTDQGDQWWPGGHPGFRRGLCCAWWRDPSGDGAGSGSRGLQLQEPGRRQGPTRACRFAFFRLKDFEKAVISPHYSTAYGETVKGERVEMGRYMYLKDTGAQPHQHPEEQIICVVSGRARVTANGQPGHPWLGPGHSKAVRGHCRLQGLAHHDVHLPAGHDGHDRAQSDDGR